MKFRASPHFSSTSGFFLFPGRWRYLRVPLIAAGLALIATGSLWGGIMLVVLTVPSYLEPSAEDTLARAREARKERRRERGEEERPAAPQVVERAPANTCVYCHDPLAAEASAALACQGCGSTYHPACFAELGRCAALGCAPASERQPSLKA